MDEHSQRWGSKGFTGEQGCQSDKNKKSKGYCESADRGQVHVRLKTARGELSRSTEEKGSFDVKVG